MFPLKIKSYLKKGEIFTLKCPKCGSIQKIEVVRHGTVLSLYDFPLHGLHSNRTAVCTGCGAKYNLSKERYERLLAMRKYAAGHRRHLFF